MIQEQIDKIKISDTKIKKLIQSIEEKVETLSKEKNYDNQLKIIDSICKDRNKYLSYYWTSYIGYLKNIKDEKYLKSEDIMAKYEGPYNNSIYKFFEVIDSIKEKNHIINKYGKRFIELAHNQKLLQSNELKLFEEEKHLRKEYRKILNNIKVNFNNEEISLIKLNKYLVSEDEKIRKESHDKSYEAIISVTKELETIFNKLLKVRNEIAKSANMKSYTEYSYIKMNRLDYTEKDLKIFKEGIVKYFIPIREKLKIEQSKRLNESKLSYYNASYLFNDGNAKTNKDLPELLQILEIIFTNISSEYGKLFSYMLENNLIDLEDRENKSAGGITTYIPDFQVPIFIKRYMDNSQNLIALTHEFGHSLQLYLNKDKILHENRWPTFDICEIHSTTMELLVSEHIDKIYGNDTKKHLITHYTNLIDILIRTSAVDDFESIVYNGSIKDTKEANEVWKDVYKKYYPTNNYDLEYFNKGIMWQRDINRIDDPFYGIDYALATIYALSFYQKYLEDREEGIKSFTNFCKDGGEISFKEIAHKYHLLSPFNEDDLIILSKFLENLLLKIN